ncbi:MAG: LacI family DNA-binding transcriptional regulator [Flavobacteriia bacterium]|jgi:LacI family transcriptional regulator
MKEKRVSLQDIATSVGVSKATVSFVLNGKGDEFNISKEKQRLIKDKAKELLYVPNFFAKSLRQTSTKTIGLVLSDISNPFYAELCKVIQEQLHEKGYNTFIVNTNDNLDMEKTLMRELIQRSIDGMIISPCNRIDELIPILHETHIPVVFTDRPGDENADFVGVDNASESSNGIQQFKIKPKKLAVIIPEQPLVMTLEKRLEGLREGCKKAAIEFEIITSVEDEKIFSQLISSSLKTGTDAMIPINNVASFQTLLALKQLNVLIPDEVRIICFEDSLAFELMQPQISAIRQPIKQIAKESVDRLIERLSTPEKPGKHLLLNCEFVSRGSH